MDKKGQSAMEYVTTYGWAILIVLIVGIVIWQLHLFDFEGKFSPGYSGFSMLVPMDWKVESGSGSCFLTVQFANGAGEGLENATLSGGPGCSPAIVPAGTYVTCSKPIGICGGPGKPYRLDLAVTYTRLADTESFQSAGEIWGNTE